MDRLDRAIRRFDEINSEDPRRTLVDGSEEPTEVVYARRMSSALHRLAPDAPEELELAARAQHVARWRIPRSEFPEGKIGYKAWRSRLMDHHAVLAGAVLREVGYGEETVARVGDLLRKRGMKRDPDVQTLEDVACLVFLEHYFDEFAERHEEDKLVDILRKTWAKMSDRGRRAALDLELSPRARRLVDRALAPTR